MGKKKKKVAATTSDWGGYGRYAPKPPKYVMTVGNADIIGGSMYQVSNLSGLSLLLDLSGTVKDYDGVVTGNDAAKRLLPPVIFKMSIPVLSVDWRDGGAEGMDRQWWEALVAYIKTLPEGSKVGVCCGGGTGRTGTALSIIAAIGNKFPSGVDPVGWLRARYHRDAVESEEQMWYVEDITGLQVHALPSDYLWGARLPPVIGKQGTTGLAGAQKGGAVTAPLGQSASTPPSGHNPT